MPVAATAATRVVGRAAAVDVWNSVAKVATAAYSIATVAAIAVQGTGRDRTNVHQVVRRIGVAVATAIRRVTSTAMSATAKTHGRNRRYRACAATVIAVLCAANPRPGAAAPPGITTTISARARPWPKRRIRITRCGDRATFCKATRRPWGRIERLPTRGRPTTIARPAAANLAGVKGLTLIQPPTVHGCAEAAVAVCVVGSSSTGYGSSMSLISYSTGISTIAAGVS